MNRYPIIDSENIKNANKLFVIDNMENREILISNNIPRIGHDFSENGYIEYDVIEKTWQSTPIFKWLYRDPPKNLVEIEIIVKDYINPKS